MVRVTIVTYDALNNRYIPFEGQPPYYDGEYVLFIDGKSFIKEITERKTLEEKLKFLEDIARGSSEERF